MIGWIVRGLLILAGLITGLFVAKEALNFKIIQMIVAIILFTAIILIAACWPMLVDLYKRLTHKNKKP